MARIRIVIPHPGELMWVAFSAGAHALLAATALVAGIAGASRPLGGGPAMLVRLAPARAAAASTGAVQHEAPPPPAAVKKNAEPTARVRPNTPDKPPVTPKGTTAQPERLPVPEPEAPRRTTPSSAGEANGHGTPAAAGDLPAGPIEGGVAGLGTDDPATPDWYSSAVITQVQDAWRDRPVLPAGSAPQRVVVAFTIERDGRVRDVSVATPSGFPPLDQSAYRALVSLGRLPAFPRNYDRPRITARFVFELLPPAL